AERPLYGLGGFGVRTRRGSVALGPPVGEGSGLLLIRVPRLEWSLAGRPCEPILWWSGDLPMAEPRRRRGPPGGEGLLRVGPTLEEGRERAAVGGQERPGIGPGLGGRAEDGGRVVAAPRGEEAERHPVERQRLAILEVPPEPL